MANSISGNNLPSINKPELKVDLNKNNVEQTSNNEASIFEDENKVDAKDKTKIADNASDLAIIDEAVSEIEQESADILNPSAIINSILKPANQSPIPTNTPTGEDISIKINGDTSVLASFIEAQNKQMGGNYQIKADVSNFGAVLNDINSLPSQQKEAALKNLVITFDNEIKNGNYDGVKPFITDSIYSINENKNDFAGNFLSNCSEKSFETVSIGNDNVKTYLDSIQDDSKYASTISDRLSKIKKEQITQENELNQKIDKNISQGQIGDCWLLSGLTSFSYTDAGSKIIDDAISETDTGFNVNFKGLNKTVEVSALELDDALKSGEYAEGDADMVLLELAFEKSGVKYSKSLSTASDSAQTPSENHDSITGGTFGNFVKAFVGDKPELASDFRNKTKSSDMNLYDKFMDFAKDFYKNTSTPGSLETALKDIESSDSVAATVSFCSPTKGESRYIKDVDGNIHEATAQGGSHSWTIKSVEGKNVTLINPWDSGKEVVVSRKELKKNAAEIIYYDFSKES